MKVVGIVQARMGSSRLPGKTLAALQGRTALAWVIRAMIESSSLDDIIVATSHEPEDDAIVRECDRLSVAVHRGPRDDVLRRFVGALQARPADAVVRITADCPLLDPKIIRLVASVGRVADEFDYVSTTLQRTLPRGLDVEFVRTDALMRADRLAAAFHRSHVTSYLYSVGGVARCLGLSPHPDRSAYRLTLDTPEDLAVIRRVCRHLGDRAADLDSVIAWLDEHPDVLAMNADVTQKALEDG